MLHVQGYKIQAVQCTYVVVHMSVPNLRCWDGMQEYLARSHGVAQLQKGDKDAKRHVGAMTEKKVRSACTHLLQQLGTYASPGVAESLAAVLSLTLACIVCWLVCIALLLLCSVCYSSLQGMPACASLRTDCCRCKVPQAGICVALYVWKSCFPIHVDTFQCHRTCA